MAGDGEHPTIERVFELLDKWRHLPAYQLERRTDIFFALYLPKVLGAHFHVEINPVVIPEFPIKKKGSNLSNNADYLALEVGAHGEGQAFLVELKTDMASRREDQDEYLSEAVKRKLHRLLKEVLEICDSTQEWGKYLHLLCELQKLELVTGVDENAPPSTREEFRRKLRDVRIEEVAKRFRLQVVYVQPKAPVDCVIPFVKFAEAIESSQKDDLMASRFACYLRKWASEKAGSYASEQPRS